MYDVIVVGAGPAGSAAALKAASLGAKTLVLERGSEPGAKNVSGAMVRVDDLKVFDVKSIPVEREVKRVRLVMGNSGEVQLEIRPRERLINVGRLKLDKWMASQAEGAGALVLTKTTALKLGPEGVITDRGEVQGKTIILAEGANALVSMGAGLRRDLTPEETVQTVKEVYSLNKDEVNKRLGLSSDQEGLSVRYLFQDPVPGAGFLYTYKDSIAFGIGVHMTSLISHKIRPQDVLEEVKRTLGIQELVKGFSLREYSAKIIPENGFPAWRPCHGNVFLAGDALGLVNPITFNGIGPAVISGALAGEYAVKGECHGYERALLGDRIVSQSVKLRPLVKELLREENMRSYISMATELSSSWVSGELSPDPVKRNSWRLFKHALLLMGAL
ncbi:MULTISPECIES: NAD(P)/FAD-dependent oxidoreductase [Metallosphaera]|uniref:FAD dependent oxidoreductase n=3 Tax=Metallosphaera TaxID=41980 RepID=A4YG57_METS5|nr:MULTISPECIES: NAD(P)/FAD-dependent oxidoreductase [Metallosphaera]ABP95409.1 FAD dependent oxidoreductase [Metallosphaera sedula DSM 5348]AIM27394.1 FAD dependent oxidoreductase [Metallosphaera sedula]AKV74271.1 FAD-dependent oxidoreductase [Metallosphaera sedula]AKV76510.1 FAD-dependent oxidoreductase [Metallosphaera sedula]AKV78762.1 FAD-dependent oxidoreductase [Metallosphaera sedula]